MSGVTNLFTGQPEGAEHASQLVNEPTGTRSVRNPGLTRTLEAGVTLIGKGAKPVDVRKWGGFDVHRGRATAVKFSATKDDRMSAEEAGAMLVEIHKMFGLDRAEEGEVWAFNKALFFSHTINSASILQPGRAVLKVGNTVFSYVDVVRKLRENLRRFFRAFADDIAVVNREILDAYDPYDLESVEKYGQIMSVATERGLAKYPEYAHDSSDACVDIQPALRAAIANGKRMVISTIVNSADALHSNTRVQTRDNYDSTNVAQVSADRANEGGRMD